MWGKAHLMMGGGRSTGTIHHHVRGGDSPVDADFSDHFVVRRQPAALPVDPELKANTKVSRSEEDVKETSDDVQTKTIGDHVRTAQIPDDADAEPQAPESIVETKKISRFLLPFQFGKRPKTPGYSPVLDGKRVPKDGDLKTSPVYNSFQSNLYPVPGRAHQIVQPSALNTSKSIKNTSLTDEEKRDNERKSLTDIDERIYKNPNPEKAFPNNSRDKNNTVGQSFSASHQKPPKTYANQSKPNVFRSSNYVSTSYIPLVPTPIASSHAVNNTSYRAQYLARNPLKKNGVSCGTGETNSQPDLSGGEGMRPRTAGENFVDRSMIPRPMTAAITTTSPRNFLHRPPKPAMFSNIPSHNNLLSHSKIPRNDFASPLSHCHVPVRPFVMLPEEDNYEYARNLSDIIPTWRHSIFKTCSQKSPIPISLIFDYLVNIRKVGEGVYGEVYKAFFRGFTDQKVYKLVPIEGNKVVNGEKQKKFGEIEPEIIVSQELNKLREGYNGCYTDGHCKLIYTRIVQGKYPSVLTEQWKTWHRTFISQNDLPEFDVTQMYVLFEFEYHGTDIESYKFRNAKQSLAVLLNVMHALAAGEAAMEFEHRDLHWGNILVMKTREPYSTYTIQGTTFRVPNCGLKSTIIDYTISRATNYQGEAIFTDLANDEDQFCGSEDYQFEIYRMMREDNQNDWSKFCPKSNIFWSHYLVGKLIDKGRYQDTTSPQHLRFKNKLFRIQSNLLKYSSCLESARRFLSSFCRDLELDI